MSLSVPSTYPLNSSPSSSTNPNSFTHLNVTVSATTSQQSATTSLPTTTSHLSSWLSSSSALPQKSVLAARIASSSSVGLLDFPPGVSLSPLPTIDKTPSRFLNSAALRLDYEPNPFDQSFAASALGASVPEPPSGNANGAGFTLSPKPILPFPNPSPRYFSSIERLDGFPFSPRIFTSQYNDSQQNSSNPWSPDFFFSNTSVPVPSTSSGLSNALNASTAPEHTVASTAASANLPTIAPSQLPTPDAIIVSANSPVPLQQNSLSLSSHRGSSQYPKSLSTNQQNASQFGPSFSVPPEPNVAPQLPQLSYTMPNSRSMPTGLPSLPNLHFSIPSSTPMLQNNARNAVQVPQHPSFAQQFLQQQLSQYSQQGMQQGQQQHEQQYRPNFPSQSNASAPGFSQAVAAVFSNGFANIGLGQQQLMPTVNGNAAAYAGARPTALNGPPLFGLSRPQSLPDSRGFSEMQQQQQQSLYGLRRPSHQLWQQQQQPDPPMLHPPSSLRNSSTPQSFSNAQRIRNDSGVSQLDHDDDEAARRKRKRMGSVSESTNSNAGGGGEVALALVAAAAAVAAAEEREVQRQKKLNGGNESKKRKSNGKRRAYQDDSEEEDEVDQEEEEEEDEDGEGEEDISEEEDDDDFVTSRGRGGSKKSGGGAGRGKRGGRGGGRAKGADGDSKRKNFLERNRQAALKCRQKKKQWLTDLQTKVETFGEANHHLTKEAEKLLEEVRFLKNSLLQHPSCSIAISNGLDIPRIEKVDADVDVPVLSEEYYRAISEDSPAPPARTRRNTSRSTAGSRSNEPKTRRTRKARDGSSALTALS